MKSNNKIYERSVKIDVFRLYYLDASSWNRKHFCSSLIFIRIHSFVASGRRNAFRLTAATGVVLMHHLFQTVRSDKSV